MSYRLVVDAEIRRREREFVASPSTATLRAFVRELALAARSDEIAALILEKPERLAALGAVEIASLQGEETGVTSHDKGAEFEPGMVRVVAWQTPSDLGGLVFVETRRTSGITWRHVAAGDTLLIVPATIGGVWSGHQSIIWLRPARGGAWEIAELCREEKEGSDPAKEIQASVSRIATAAGAVLNVEPEGIVFWD